MTISRERITFNLFCMRQFADIGYIQLLLHPSERKIAIRPCGRDAAHSVKWRSDATKLLYPKALCCRHFGAALFHIMEWDPDLLYRVQGTWIRRGDGQICAACADGGSQEETDRTVPGAMGTWLR